MRDDTAVGKLTVEYAAHLEKISSLYPDFVEAFDYLESLKFGYGYLGDMSSKDVLHHIKSMLEAFSRKVALERELEKHGLSSLIKSNVFDVEREEQAKSGSPYDT